jgi:hypothetical protein
VASTPQTWQQPDVFSILLDQGFPKPTPFAIENLDHTVRVVHFSELRPRTRREEHGLVRALHRI